MPLQSSPRLPAKSGASMSPLTESEFDFSISQVSHSPNFLTHPIIHVRLPPFHTRALFQEPGDFFIAINVRKESMLFCINDLIRRLQTVSQLQVIIWLITMALIFMYIFFL